MFYRDAPGLHPRRHALEPRANAVRAGELFDGERAVMGLLDLIERVHEHLEQHRTLAPLQAIDFSAARVAR